MIFARPSGEAVFVASKSRMTDPEDRRARALQMLAMRNFGQTTAQIAKYFRVTPRWVRKELSTIPAVQKDRVNGILG